MVSHMRKGVSLYHFKNASLCAVILASLSLIACNKVQITDLGADVAGLSSPPDTPIVNAACANNPKQTQDYSFNFPKPNYTCEWNQNGNLERRNEYFQARIEQKNEINLGAGAIICNVSFNFANQQFLYDDHFLMSFNNAVIASSFDFSGRLSSQYGLLRYDWSKIAGMFWDKSKEGTFCAAEGSCSWPITDTPGTIKMSYSSAVFQRIMAEDLNRSSHSINFISIGDNDDMDCEHSNINFTLRVEYVVPK